MINDQKGFDDTKKGNAIKIDFDDGSLSLTVQSEVEDLNVLEKLITDLFSKISVTWDNENSKDIYC